MRILYDHQAFSLQNTGGITRYFFELISRFASIDDIHPEILLGFSGTMWPIREASRPNGKVVHWGKRLSSSGMLTYALNELLLNVYATSHRKVDIYHNTLYRFMPSVRARRLVATHHDCVQERFPELFPDHARIFAAKRRMFKRADLVLCVSESSRSDLEHFYGVEPNRTKVIYNGVSPMVRSESGKAELLQKVHRPFLLYVGIRAAYKNFNGFLEAFAETGLADRYDLVAVGGGRFSDQELHLIQDLGIRNAVVSIPFASPDLLAEAYANAALLVYPSLYEGFGLPPLEAMAMRTPALVAATPATLEVCMDAAFFFNPQDFSDFTCKLRFALENEEMRNGKITQGLKVAQQYKWDQTAMQVLAAYESIL
jgi:glycosyltransferase involved in cell wall biosynthesis